MPPGASDRSKSWTSIVPAREIRNPFSPKKTGFFRPASGDRKPVLFRENGFLSTREVREMSTTRTPGVAAILIVALSAGIAPPGLGDDLRPSGSDPRGHSAEVFGVAFSPDGK